MINSEGQKHQEREQNFNENMSAGNEINDEELAAAAGTGSNAQSAKDKPDANVGNEDEATAVDGEEEVKPPASKRQNTGETAEAAKPDEPAAEEEKEEEEIPASQEDDGYIIVNGVR